MQDAFNFYNITDVEHLGKLSHWYMLICIPDLLFTLEVAHPSPKPREVCLLTLEAIDWPNGPRKFI